MAIVGTVYGNYVSKWGIIGTPTGIGQTTFGTVQADNVAGIMLEGPIPTIDFGRFRDNSVKQGDGRMRNVANDYVSGNGGLRVISFSDVLIRYKDLGVLLYAVCQNVTEAASTPFEKTFTLSGATTQPNFTANAGMFLTLGIYDSIANFHKKFNSCILRTLTLSADLSGDGLLRASGEFISGFAASTTSAFVGSWAYNTQNYFNFHTTPTKKIASNDVVLYGFDITINNNAVRVGSTGANGDCETYALAVGDTGYEVSGNIKVKYDTNTQALLAADLAGTTTAIQLACGTDGATGNFDFTDASCLLQGTEKDYGDARGQAINIPFIANASAIFTVSDALDRTW